MTAKPRFEASEDVEKCYLYMKSRDRASYQELSTHLGRDIRGPDRYVLQAARRKLERAGIIFVTVTGFGVQRANSAQIAELSTSTPIGKIKRTVRQSDRRQRIVDVQGLSEEQRAAFYIGRAVLGAIGQAARDVFRNKIAKATDVHAGEPLPIEETMKLFSQLRPRSNGADH